jgi:hypothetical protein
MGEVLLEEFLKPMGISQNHLAIKIGVPAAVSMKSFWVSALSPLYGKVNLCFFEIIIVI